MQVILTLMQLLQYRFPGHVHAEVEHPVLAPSIPGIRIPRWVSFAEFTNRAGQSPVSELPNKVPTLGGLLVVVLIRHVGEVRLNIGCHVDGVGINQPVKFLW
jgi:hypothetical protein